MRTFIGALDFILYTHLLRCKIIPIIAARCSPSTSLVIVSPRTGSRSVIGPIGCTKGPFFCINVLGIIIWKANWQCALKTSNTHGKCDSSYLCGLEIVVSKVNEDKTVLCGQELPYNTLEMTRYDLRLSTADMLYVYHIVQSFAIAQLNAQLNARNCALLTD